MLQPSCDCCQPVFTSCCDPLMKPHINLYSMSFIHALLSLNEHAGAWAPDLTVAPSICFCRGNPAAAKPCSFKFRPLCGNRAQASFGAFWLSSSCAWAVPVFLEAFQLPNSPQDGVGASHQTVRRSASLSPTHHPSSLRSFCVSAL